MSAPHSFNRRAPSFSSTLNRRVGVLVPTVSSGSSGEQITTYADLSTAPDGKLYASKLVLNGIETVRNGAVTSTVKASFRFRMRSDFSANMRVVDDGVTYNVLTVIPDPNRVYVDLACESLPA